MKLDDVLVELRRLSPEHLAESWDRVGLHLGEPGWTVKRALLAIDLTEAVLAEARRRRCRLVVAYHPPIFKPLERLTGSSWKERVILEAARHRIAIYSPHTALDAAEGGMNDWLAAGLGEGRCQPIVPTPRAGELKLVVFVPREEADRLRARLAESGAGRIGDYEQCSYNLEGTGTFLGGEGANPAVGERGRLERVAETRIEMVVPRACQAQVVACLRRHHPYEEPAFDLYPVEPDPAPLPTGAGRVLELKRPIALDTALKRIARRLGRRTLKVARPESKRRIRRIGLSPGAGGSLLEAAGDVDLFFTGEMRHHDVLDARERGIAVALAGHTATERPYLPHYAKRLAEICDPVAWEVSEQDVLPLREGWYKLK